MPRSGQIIPEYLHPHEMTVINDNTRYEDYVSGDSDVRFLNVFASSKGRDNVLLPFTSVTDWVNEYGLPDYRRFGQPGYNAYVALSTGLAGSQSMRVMPPDAAHANMVLVAKYQVADGKLKMKFETKTVTGILNSDDLQAYVDRMEDSEPDEEGYQTLPIMSFWSRGRGVYGNDYRVRISRDKGADKENDYVNYVFELLTMENGSLEVLESYNVSMYLDAIDPNSNFTLYVNDIIDDSENKGSTRFNCSVVYDNLVKIFEAYQEAFEEGTTVLEEKVDKLPPTSLPDPDVVFVNTTDKQVSVFNAGLGTFESFAAGATLVETTVMPVVLGVEEPNSGTQPYYIVETTNTNKVWKYESDAMSAQAGTFHSVADISTEDSLTENDFYYDEATTTYYIAGAANSKTTIQACQTTATCAEGARVAKTKLLYKVDGNYYTFSGTDLSSVSNVTEVTELPSTEIAKENTYYTLTAQDGDKPLGSSWIYDFEEEEWVAYDPNTDKPEMPYTMETWDIFGYNKFTTENDPYFEFEGGTEAISILSIEGVPLNSGDDGSFAEGVADDVREEALEAAYLAAFNGEFDKTIASKRRAPVDIMLDANYSTQVKRAMVALAVNRFDCAVHLDTNLINNVADLDTWYTQISDLNQYIVSYDAHMFKTSDPITGKIIPVTITLWLSQKYPTHYNVYGNHTPLAGEEYGVLSGYQRNSILPIIDADDLDVKEHLYADLHMNYVECLEENVFIRGTQQTSQNYWSDLSEENNVLVLLEIKRKIERLATSNRYKWAEPDNLRLFQEACEEVFSSYTGTKCRSLSIRVDMNAWEETRYIVHIYLEVVFRTFQKRAIIEIDVNPRA